MIIMLKVNTQCPQWSISSLESYACDLKSPEHAGVSE